MKMAAQREVTLWPSPENYARFRSVCDDSVPDTFEEFQSLATARMAEIEKREGIKIEKIAFDPDRMAQWCRANFGKVDSNTRGLYAAFISLSD
ncbi:MAG: hypothetical protein E7812_09055 [Phenylobacterium sp.]|nr:MAG: hypothetical protein E7812_09055 [Phenylobacterium sp.]